MLVAKSGETFGFTTFVGFEGGGNRAAFVLTNSGQHFTSTGATDTSLPDAADVVGCGILRAMPPAMPNMRCPSNW